MSRLIPEQEIAIHSREKALEIAAALVDEDYVVSISKEDELYIINYVWSPESDRNGVVFMNRDNFEMDYIERDTKE